MFIVRRSKIYETKVSSLPDPKAVNHKWMLLGMKWIKCGFAPSDVFKF